MYALNFDLAICESCDTCDCLMRCQYMTFDLEEAKREKANINNGKDSRVLTALPGVAIREMDRSMQDALCCGGGGGNLFTDILGNGPESPARNRVAEALDTGAEILAVRCPTCAVMLGDAVKSNNMEERIQVKEISEIVNERLNDPLC